MTSAKAKWAANVKRTGNEPASAPQGFGKRERQGIDDANKRVIAPRKDSKVTALKSAIMKLSAFVSIAGKKPPAKRKRS